MLVRNCPHLSRFDAGIYEPGVQGGGCSRSSVSLHHSFSEPKPVTRCAHAGGGAKQSESRESLNAETQRKVVVIYPRVH
jgi:hypothetical protein